MIKNTIFRRFQKDDHSEIIKLAKSLNKWFTKEAIIQIKKDLQGEDLKGSGIK